MLNREFLKKIHYSVKQKANKVVYLIKMLKILGNEGQNSKKNY